MPHLYNVAHHHGGSGEERPHRLLDAPWLRSLRIARTNSTISTGPPSNRSSSNCGRTVTRPCSMRKGTGTHHLESFAELPDLSIVYHVDQGDIFKAHEVLGRQVLSERWYPEFPAGLSASRRRARLLQEGPRRSGTRRRLHHGRERDRAERRHRREHACDDRRHARIRGLLGRPLLAGSTRQQVDAWVRTGRVRCATCRPRAIPPGTCFSWDQKRKAAARTQRRRAVAARTSGKASTRWRMSTSGNCCCRFSCRPKINGPLWGGTPRHLRRPNPRGRHSTSATRAALNADARREAILEPPKQADDSSASLAGS